MVKLKINNADYEVQDGLTILDIARSAGIYIPTLCHNEKLPHYSSCMVCMVKDQRTGTFYLHVQLCFRMEWTLIVHPKRLSP